VDSSAPSLKEAAFYLDDLLKSGKSPECSIQGVGLLHQDRAIHDALKAQDYLYTVVELSSGGSHARVIGSLFDHIYAPEQPETAIAAMADPECRIERGGAPGQFAATVKPEVRRFEHLLRCRQTSHLLPP
jgi:hypothetical protein